MAKQTRADILAGMSTAQKTEYKKILKSQGASKANRYIDNYSKASAAAPVVTEAPITGLDISDPNAVIEAARTESERATRASTPNIVTDDSSRVITYDPLTGQPTITEKLSPEQLALKRGSEATTAGAQDLARKYQEQLTNQGQFDPQANNPFVLDPNGFKGMQDKVYTDAVDRYTRDNQEQIDRARRNEETRLANQGYSFGDPEYQRALARFDQSIAAARENLVSTAYRDSTQIADAALRTQLSGNQQVYDQNLGAYKLPAEMYGQVTPTATGYVPPNLGSVQSVNTNPVDISGLAGSYNTAQTSAANNAANIASNEKIARGQAATARATKSASYNPVDAIRAKGAEDRATIGFETGLTAGLPGPYVPPGGPTTGEVLGDVAGNFISGGINAYGNRRYLVTRNS